MNPTTPAPPGPDRSGVLLAAVVARRAEENRAAADVLGLVADYCAVNRVTCLGEAAVEESPVIGDHGIPLAGEGAPLVAEFAVVELGAALGMSTMSAKRLVGDVLELAYRLPNLWARVIGYEVPAWKARLVAQHTKSLCPDAAGFVDVEVAPTAERYGYARLDRLVVEAGARYAPDLTAVADHEAEANHKVTITTRPDPGVGLDTMAGHAFVEATLDPADALDLEAAVAAIAHGLLEDSEHPEYAQLSLDRRRAKALGMLGRSYTTGQVPGGVARVVHLYCHVKPGEGTGLVAVDQLKTVVPLERLGQWATTPGTVVKPVTVIDLNEQLTREGYEPSNRQREQAYLTARTCVFPGCDRPAVNLDLDHIEAYATGGETSSANLAPLCRGHHRAKTFDQWCYVQIHPGEYLWTSPHGAQYLRHRGGGTTPLPTPTPIRTPDTDTG